MLPVPVNYAGTKRYPYRLLLSRCIRSRAGILDTILFGPCDVMTVRYRVKDFDECTDRKIKNPSELVLGSGRYKLVARNYWDLFFI